MPEALHGVNVIKAGDRILLLTEVGGGTAIHLTPEQREGGRGAIEAFYLDNEREVPTVRNYDGIALLEARWSPKTLCGKEWALMASGDGGILSPLSEVAFAPNCRRCLSLMDQHFPQPRVHDRLGLVAQMTADLVCEHGYAEVEHVPGDQQAALRKAVRALVRKQSGHASTTSSKIRRYISTAKRPPASDVTRASVPRSRPHRRPGCGSDPNVRSDFGAGLSSPSADGGLDEFDSPARGGPTGPRSSP